MTDKRTRCESDLFIFDGGSGFYAAEMKRFLSSLNSDLNLNINSDLNWLSRWKLRIFKYVELKEVPATRRKY